MSTPLNMVLRVTALAVTSWNRLISSYTIVEDEDIGLYGYIYTQYGFRLTDRAVMLLDTLDSIGYIEKIEETFVELYDYFE